MPFIYNKTEKVQFQNTLESELAGLFLRLSEASLLPQRRCECGGDMVYIANDAMIDRYECLECGHSDDLMYVASDMTGIDIRNDTDDDMAGIYYKSDPDGMLTAFYQRVNLEIRRILVANERENSAPDVPEGTQDRDNAHTASETPQEREERRRERDTALPNWTGKFKMSAFCDETERPSAHRSAKRASRRVALPPVPESEKVSIPAGAPQTFAEAKEAEAAAKAEYKAAIKGLLQMRRDGADAGEIKRVQLRANELRAAKTVAMRRRIALDMNN